jgi:hypothetical protein
LATTGFGRSMVTATKSFGTRITNTLSARSTPTRLRAFGRSSSVASSAQFHKVSAKYLPLYVAEFQFRYNNRMNTDMFETAIAGC